MRTVSGRLRRLEQRSADTVAEWMRTLSDAELEALAGPELHALSDEQLARLAAGEHPALIVGPKWRELLGDAV
jgi:hypothetical protein